MMRGVLLVAVVAAFSCGCKAAVAEPGGDVYEKEAEPAPGLRHTEVAFVARLELVDVDEVHKEWILKVTSQLWGSAPDEVSVNPPDTRQIEYSRYLAGAPIEVRANRTYVVAARRPAGGEARIRNDDITAIIPVDETAAERRDRYAYTGRDRNFDLPGIDRLPCARRLVELDERGLDASRKSLADLAARGQLSRLDLLRLIGRPDAEDPEIPANATDGALLYLIRSPKLMSVVRRGPETTTTVPTLRFTTRAGRVTGVEQGTWTDTWTTELTH